MSTLQHTLQPAFRNRVALLVVLAGALAALTVVLIVSSGGSNAAVPAPQPTHAAIPDISPQHQLEAVAGARYQQLLAGRHDR